MNDHPYITLAIKGNCYVSNGSAIISGCKCFAPCLMAAMTSAATSNTSLELGLRSVPRVMTLYETH